MATKSTSERSHADDDKARQRDQSTTTPLGAAKAGRMAVEQVAELTGREPIGIVGVETHDAGWRVDVEVVETSRIPSSADMLATYTAELTEDGTLSSCRRASRYLRGSGYADGGGR